MDYKGYKIITRQTRERFANIIGPDGRALTDTPKATIEEGEEILVTRAKAIIDADISEIQRVLAQKREAD